MAKLKRIGVLSFARFLAVVMAFAGLIAGVLYAVIGATYDALTGAVGHGTALAFLAIIGMPIMFATFGFAVGVIGTFLYNLAAKWIGEIEMDFEQ